MRPIREAHSAASSSFHLIFYDFDSGGPGWRASDPYGVLQYGETNGLWDAFLNGYTEVRPFERSLTVSPRIIRAWPLARRGGYTTSARTLPRSPITRGPDAIIPNHATLRVDFDKYGHWPYSSM